MCSCSKKNANIRKPTSVPRPGLTSDLARSRQAPAPMMRQLAQAQLAKAQQSRQSVLSQENAKKIRQRSIREKFGHV